MLVMLVIHLCHVKRCFVFSEGACRPAQAQRIAPTYGRGDSEIRELKVKTGFSVAKSEHARVTRAIYYAVVLFCSSMIRPISRPVHAQSPTSPRSRSSSAPYCLHIQRNASSSLLIFRDRM